MGGLHGRVVEQRNSPDKNGKIHMIGDWIDKVECPQLPAMTDEELVTFFGQALFARLGTINEDGTIHMAPVFFRYADGQILIATQEPSRKIRTPVNLSYCLSPPPHPTMRRDISGTR